MNRIFLVDLVGDKVGHYFILKPLLKIADTQEVDTKEKKILLKRHLIKGLIERVKMIRRSLKQIPKTPTRKVAHLITGDKFYMIPFTWGLKSRNLSVIITLHRFPANKFLQILLYIYSKKIKSIIVYSDFIKKECNKRGINNIEVINFPTFYDYSGFADKTTLKEKIHCSGKIIISALGGTRKEKGLDILLDSFSYIDSDIKNKIVLNIAGKENDIKEEYIKEKAKKNNINTILTLKELTDEEFCQNVILTDIMVIPYRKSFNSGASGPMTEAMSQSIPCIFPDSGSLGFYSKYNIGKSFEIENSKSLAETITAMVVNFSESNIGTDSALFSIDNFISQHSNIYNKYL